MPLYGKIVVIKRNGSDGTHFPLTASSCLFGRKTECDIRIQLPHVSKEHCKIEVNENKEAIVTNLSSVNPTQLNGVCIEQPVALIHGDILTVIDRSFRFEYPSQSTPKRKRNSTAINNELLQVAEIEPLRTRRQGAAVIPVSDDGAGSDRGAEENTESTDKISGGLSGKLHSSTVKTAHRRSKSFKEHDQSPFSELYEMLKHHIDIKPKQQDDEKGKDFEADDQRNVGSIIQEITGSHTPASSRRRSGRKSLTNFTESMKNVHTPLENVEESSFDFSSEVRVSARSPLRSGLSVSKYQYPGLDVTPKLGFKDDRGSGVSSPNAKILDFSETGQPKTNITRVSDCKVGSVGMLNYQNSTEETSRSSTREESNTVCSHPGKTIDEMQADRYEDFILEDHSSKENNGKPEEGSKRLSQRRSLSAQQVVLEIQDELYSDISGRSRSNHASLVVSESPEVLANAVMQRGRSGLHQTHKSATKTPLFSSHNTYPRESASLGQESEKGSLSTPDTVGEQKALTPKRGRPSRGETSKRISVSQSRRSYSFSTSPLILDTPSLSAEALQSSAVDKVLPERLSMGDSSHSGNVVDILQLSFETQESSDQEFASPKQRGRPSMKTPKSSSLSNRKAYPRSLSLGNELESSLGQTKEAKISGSKPTGRQSVNLDAKMLVTSEHKRHPRSASLSNTFENVFSQLRAEKSTDFEESPLKRGRFVEGQTPKYTSQSPMRTPRKSVEQKSVTLTPKGRPSITQTPKAGDHHAEQKSSSATRGRPRINSPKLTSISPPSSLSLQATPVHSPPQRGRPRKTLTPKSASLSPRRDSYHSDGAVETQNSVLPESQNSLVKRGRGRPSKGKTPRSISVSPQRASPRRVDASDNLVVFSKPDTGSESQRPLASRTLKSAPTAEPSTPALSSEQSFSPTRRSRTLTTESPQRLSTLRSSESGENVVSEKKRGRPSKGKTPKSVVSPYSNESADPTSRSASVSPREARSPIFVQSTAVDSSKTPEKSLRTQRDRKSTKQTNDASSSPRRLSSPRHNASLHSNSDGVDSVEVMTPSPRPRGRPRKAEAQESPNDKITPLVKQSTPVMTLDTKMNLLSEDQTPSAKSRSLSFDDSRNSYPKRSPSSVRKAENSLGQSPLVASSETVFSYGEKNVFSVTRKGRQSIAQSPKLISAALISSPLSVQLAPAYLTSAEQNMSSAARRGRQSMQKTPELSPLSLPLRISPRTHENPLTEGKRSSPKRSSPGRTPKSASLIFGSSNVNETTSLDLLETTSATKKSSSASRRSRSAVHEDGGFVTASVEDSSSAAKSKRLSPRRHSGSVNTSEVDVSKKSPKKRRSGELDPLPEPPLKRKRVSFGGHLSPELFDKRLPPNSPLRKGATPARLSLQFSNTPRAVIRKSFGIRHAVIQERSDKRSPNASPTKLSSSKKSPVKSPVKRSPSRKSLSTSPAERSPSKKMPVTSLASKSPSTETVITLPALKSPFRSTANLSPASFKSPRRTAATVSPNTILMKESSAATGSPATSPGPGRSSARGSPATSPAPGRASARGSPATSPAPRRASARGSPATSPAPGRASARGSPATSPAPGRASARGSPATSPAPGRASARGSPATSPAPGRASARGSPATSPAPGRASARGSPATSPAPGRASARGSPATSPAPGRASARGSPATSPAPGRASARGSPAASPAPGRASARGSPAASPAPGRASARGSPAASPAPGRASARGSPAASPAPGRASARGSPAASPAPGRASARGSPAASPAPGRASARGSPAASPAPGRASARGSPAASPAPGRASARGSPAASPAPGRASARGSPAASPAPGRESARGSHAASPAPGRASVRGSPATSPAFGRASARGSPATSPAPKRASVMGTPAVSPASGNAFARGSHMSSRGGSPANVRAEVDTVLLMSLASTPSIPSPAGRTPSKGASRSPAGRTPSKGASRSPAGRTPSKGASRSPAGRTPSKGASRSPAGRTPSKGASRSPAGRTPSKGASRSPAGRTPSKGASRSPAGRTPSKGASRSPAGRTPSKGASRSPAGRTPSKGGSRSPAGRTPSKGTPRSPAGRTPSKGGSRSPAGRTPSKGTLMSISPKTPYSRGRFSVSKITTPTALQEDTGTETNQKVIVVQKPENVWYQAAQESENKYPKSVERRKTPSRRKSRSEAVEAFRSRRKSGATEANLLVAKSWADIVKLGVARTQVKKVKRGVKVQVTKKKLTKSKTPARKVKGHVSTGHADSPATIVIGKAHSRTVPLAGQAPRVVKNYSLIQRMDANESFTGMTEMFTTPKGGHKASRSSTPAKAPAEELSVMLTPEESGEMIVSPLSSTPVTKKHRQYSQDAVSRLLRGNESQSSSENKLTRMSKGKSPKAVNLENVKETYKTPESARSRTSKVEVTESRLLNDSLGLRRIMKTPKEKAKSVLDSVALKRLLRTPRPKRQSVIHELAAAVTNTSDKSELNLVGIKRLMKTPKQKGQEVLDMAGVSRIMKTPKQKGKLVESRLGIRRLMRTPKEYSTHATKTPRQKVQPVEDMIGISRIMKTPKNKTQPVEDMIGIKRIMASPKQKSLPLENLRGISRLLRTPKERVVPSVRRNTQIKPMLSDVELNYSGIKEMFETPKENKMKPTKNLTGSSTVRASTDENDLPHPRSKMLSSTKKTEKEGKETLNAEDKDKTPGRLRRKLETSQTSKKSLPVEMEDVGTSLTEHKSVLLTHKIDSTPTRRGRLPRGSVEPISSIDKDSSTSKNEELAAELEKAFGKATTSVAGSLKKPAVKETAKAPLRSGRSRCKMDVPIVSELVKIITPSTLQQRQPAQNPKVKVMESLPTEKAPTLLEMPISLLNKVTKKAVLKRGTGRLRGALKGRSGQDTSHEVLHENVTAVDQVVADVAPTKTGRGKRVNNADVRNLPATPRVHGKKDEIPMEVKDSKRSTRGRNKALLVENKETIEMLPSTRRLRTQTASIGGLQTLEKPIPNNSEKQTNSLEKPSIPAKVKKSVKWHPLVTDVTPSNPESAKETQTELPNVVMVSAESPAVEAEETLIPAKKTRSRVASSNLPSSVKELVSEKRTRIGKSVLTEITTNASTKEVAVEVSGLINQRRGRKNKLETLHISVSDPAATKVLAGGSRTTEIQTENSSRTRTARGKQANKASPSRESTLSTVELFVEKDAAEKSKDLKMQKNVSTSPRGRRKNETRSTVSEFEKPAQEENVTADVPVESSNIENQNTEDKQAVGEKYQNRIRTARSRRTANEVSTEEKPDGVPNGIVVKDKVLVEEVSQSGIVNTRRGRSKLEHLSSSVRLHDSQSNSIGSGSYDVACVADVLVAEALTEETHAEKYSSKRKTARGKQPKPLIQMSPPKASVSSNIKATSLDTQYSAEKTSVKDEENAALGKPKGPEFMSTAATPRKGKNKTVAKQSTVNDSFTTRSKRNEANTVNVQIAESNTDAKSTKKRPTGRKQVTDNTSSQSLASSSANTSTLSDLESTFLLDKTSTANEKSSRQIGRGRTNQSNHISGDGEKLPQEKLINKKSLRRTETTTVVVSTRVSRRGQAGILPETDETPSEDQRRGVKRKLTGKEVATLLVSETEKQLESLPTKVLLRASRQSKALRTAVDVRESATKKDAAPEDPVKNMSETTIREQNVLSTKTVGKSKAKIVPGSPEVPSPANEIAKKRKPKVGKEPQPALTLTESNTSPKKPKMEVSDSTFLKARGLRREKRRLSNERKVTPDIEMKRTRARTRK
ncbi:proliferation marker protein Ki-67 [Pleurodeles waltl]